MSQKYKDSRLAFLYKGTCLKNYEETKDHDLDHEIWEGWRGQWLAAVETIPKTFIPTVCNRLGVKDLSPRKDLLVKLLSLCYEAMPKGAIADTAMKDARRR